ncbi:hypothetical protein, partial [Burkholderia pseudomallei]
RHEFLERHHLEFVLRGHGRLQHHAIKKQKPRTWRGFVSNLDGLQPVFSVSARRKSGSLKISANVARRTPPLRSDRAELPAQELVEVLHAVFHRALIRADLRFAALH